MAELTYWDLEDRNMPPVEGDTLLIYGIHYTVCKNAKNSWYLKSDDGPNDKIFDLFGLTAAQKMTWAISYCQRGTCQIGLFPEFTDRKDFADFIIALYEHPLLSEGDSIVIKSREGGTDDYPCSYVCGMVGHAGKRFTISRVNIFNLEDETKHKYFNGDIHFYTLKEDTGAWNWHSSMFDLSTLRRYEKSTRYTSRLDAESSVPLDKEKEEADKKKEVPSKGIILNKPKKHFKTTIVL